MCRGKIMKMIGRVEILVDEAEKLTMKYPDLLNKKGFLDRLFGDDEKDEARSRFQNILYEIFGVASNIKETLREYGISLKSEALTNLIEDANE